MVDADIEAARAGDPAALDRLLAGQAARIYRFGMRMCGDPEEAKDVMQDTLLAAARGIAGFRGDASFPTWLFTIARSFCSKRRKKAAIAQSLASEAAPAADAVLDPARSPDEIVEGKEIEDVLERAIAALDPKYREVLVLRDVEGFTAPEVAEVLGIGVDAVKSRLHRARLSVREAVAPRLGIPFAAEERGPACPDVLAMLSRHVEDDLRADVCAEMEQHLLGCPRCRGRCDSLRRTLALCRAQPVADVPPAIAASVRAALRDFLAHPR